METLEVLILELDGIGVEGHEEVRVARRAAVREIQQAIEMLEFRAATSNGNDGGTGVEYNNSDQEGSGDKGASGPAFSTAEKGVG